MSNQLSQLPVEIVIQSDAPVLARVSQLSIEVVVAPPVTSLQISQLPIEVVILELTAFETTQFFIIMS